MVDEPLSRDEKWICSLQICRNILILRSKYMANMVNATFA